MDSSQPGGRGRGGQAGCCPKFTFPTFTPDPNLHFPHLHRTQIYTNPNLHKPRFTPDPNLHSPPLAYPNLHISNLHKTEPKFTQTQIYTGPNLHSHFWTDFKQPKFTRPKFTQNPNLHNPNLRNPNLHTTKKAKRRSRVRFEPRATFEHALLASARGLCLAIRLFT